MLTHTAIQKTDVLRIIKAQFPDTPEAALMYSVIEQAVRDLFLKPRTNPSGKKSTDYRPAAMRYLTGEMWAAEVCGVESSWITGQLKKAGML